MSIEKSTQLVGAMQRHYVITGAEHRDDGSVVLAMQRDGLEEEGVMPHYPPEHYYETRRFQQRSLIIPHVVLELDGEPFEGVGSTVEDADQHIINGVLFVRAARQPNEAIAATE